MKQKFFSFLAVALCTGLLFTACKKSDTTENSTTTNAQMATQADDESMLSDEMDNSAADVSTAVEADASFSGNNSVLDRLICDASITFNKDSDPMTMTLTYDSSSCSAARTRSGVIVISMAKGTEWKNAGATVTVTYHDLKITRALDKKTIVINGSHTYVNVNGKLLSQLASSGPIVHNILSSNMSISFDNGTARTWNISRKHTFTYDNGVILTITGLHTEGDVTGIAAWGMNRFNNAFTTVISTPLVVKQSCNLRITEGVVTHTTAAYIATVTFGLDATGVVTGCPGDGHYYYHLDCTTSKGATLSIVLPY
jgi:hypothetical protein